jgi:hypothetical protein
VTAHCSAVRLGKSKRSERGAALWPLRRGTALRPCPLHPFLCLYVPRSWRTAVFSRPDRKSACKRRSDLEGAPWAGLKDRFCCETTITIIMAEAHQSLLPANYRLHFRHCSKYSSFATKHLVLFVVRVLVAVCCSHVFSFFHFTIFVISFTVPFFLLYNYLELMFYLFQWPFSTNSQWKSSFGEVILV